jgi:hypothetical protein
MDITIASTSIPNWQHGGTTAALRIFCPQGFTSSDGVTVLPSRRGEKADYQDVPCTVAGTILTIPSFTLRSTTDSIDNPAARYDAVLVDNRGVEREIFFADFAVRHDLGAVVSWSQLRINRAARQPQRDLSVYTKEEIHALLAQFQAVSNPATAAALGRLKASYAPADAASPYALITDDPRVGAGVTVYAARFPGPTIAAKINAADDFINALGAASGTIIVEGGGELCHPTDPTLSLCTPSENRVIKLCAGVYTNAYGWAAPFRLSNNTVVEGDGQGTILKQVTAANSAESHMIFVPFVGSVANGQQSRAPSKNIHIRNLQISGDDGTGYTANTGTINLGNCHFASVVNVLFTNPRCYAVQVGGSAETAGDDPEGLGYYASDVLVDNCTVTGAQSQNIAVVNAKRVKVTRCNLLKPNTTNQSLTMIDVEPAEASAVIEDIEIDGNVVDVRGRIGAGAVNGIQVQGVPVGVVAKRVKVLNNIVIGGENGSASALTIGISLSGSTLGCRIEGNQVWGSQSAGILTYSTGSHLLARIADNLTYNCGNTSTDNYAISVGGAVRSLICDNWLYHNPVVTGNSRCQEEANSDYNVFQDNIHSGSDTQAFTLVTGAHSRESFTGDNGSRFLRNLYPVQNDAPLGIVGQGWNAAFTKADIAENGLYTYSPDGTRYRIRVANGGAISTVAAPAAPPVTPPPDLVAPTLVSATADVDVDAFLVVGTFSEDIAATNFTDGFIITVDGFVCTILSGVLQPDGNTVHWTLGAGGFSGLTPGAVATVEYDGSGDVGDLASNALAAFAPEAIVISGSGA